VNPSDGRIVLGCYNDLPEGVKDTPERREQRPLKYWAVDHAESSLVHRAARLGIKTAGLHMYGTWVACSECAKSIIASGIVRVVGHRHPAQAAHGTWQEDIAFAMTMLTEAGVTLEWYDEKIGGGLTVRFLGKEVEV
jgi:dCMP deaminase